MADKEFTGALNKVYGISGLYVKHLKNGGRRYQLKVSIDGHDYYKTLDNHPDDSMAKIAYIAEETRKKLVASVRGKSIEDYMEDFLSTRRYSDATKLLYRGAITGFSLDNTANSNVVQVLLNDETTVSTKHRKIGEIHRFFHWLAAIRPDIEDPTEGYSVPNTVNARTRTLTDSEIITLLDGVDRLGTAEDRLYARLLLYTGCRVGTAACLTAGSMHEWRLYLYNAKCGKRYDVAIPITDTTTRELWATLCEGRPRSAPVFESPDNLRARLDRRMRRWFPKDATGEGLSPHSLRHTFATRALQSGVPLSVVSKLLDHANPGTTLKFYAKHSQSQIDDGVAAAVLSMHPLHKPDL